MLVIQVCHVWLITLTINKAKAESLYLSILSLLPNDLYFLIVHTPISVCSMHLSMSVSSSDDEDSHRGKVNGHTSVPINSSTYSLYMQLH